MMKKRFAACLLAALLMGQTALVFATGEKPFPEERIECNTDFSQQEEGFQALLQQKLSELNGITSYSSTPGMYHGYNLMPSTGTVRVLVLPIEFNDYKIQPSSYDRMKLALFAENNDPSKNNYEISARALLQRLSYGRLDVVGDILPVYTASENQNAYNTRVSYFKLVSEALGSYFDEDPNRNYSDYDSDGDGYLDALIIKWAGKKSTVFSHSTSLADGLIPINDENIKIKCVIHSPIAGKSYHDAHELAHCMGLIDTYLENYCFIDDTLTDLMSCAAAHLNVFFQYLLGWVDPIILTGDDDPVKEITFQTAQWFGGDLDQDTPRAIVYIPEEQGLPITEFYIAEYRNNTYDHGFLDKRGIVLWHCDAAIDENNLFINQMGYLKPVYKSGGTANPLGNIEFMEDDFYVEGSVFSPETTPNSNFYDDVYTGIYMEVKELQKDYAVLNTGFLQAHSHEYSADWKTDGDNHWHECECGEKKDDAAHIPAEDKAVEPTCTTAGKTAGSHCSVCEYIITAQTETAATGHSYSEDWKTDGDNHWHECTACGEKKDEAAHIPAEDKAVEPTCTTAGKTAGSHCSVCEYIITAQTETAATGHSYSEDWKTDGDNHWHECTTCGDIKDTAAHTEDSGTVTMAPTASTAGVRTYTCTVCGRARTESIPATGSGSTPSGEEPSPDDWDDDDDDDRIEEQPPEIKPAEPEKSVFAFADMRPDAWYYGAVEECYNKGLLKSITETQFMPESSSSRGMVVYALYRMEGEPFAGNNSYSDVPSDRYYAPAVAWATANGIVMGYGDGIFRPDEPITREELAAILYRYGSYKGGDMTARADLSGFTDAEQISEYARQPMSWAKAEGFINGTDWGGIHPGGQATRAEMATVLLRVLTSKR